MGSAKALLDAGGQTFLARVVSALATGGCSPVVVVVRDAVGAVATEAEACGAVVVVNPDPAEGPISSIRLALTEWGGGVDGCAVCPVDHPLVAGATVRSLAARFKDVEADIVIPAYRGRRGHPAIFHRRLFTELLDPNLPEGARTVVRRRPSRVRECPVEDAGVVADIDTPSEYRRHFQVV
jgi:nicotine blue oxidoreductase